MKRLQLIFAWDFDAVRIIEESVIQSPLALRTPYYNGHPYNMDSSKIPGKNKLRTLANEDTNSRFLQCPL